MKTFTVGINQKIVGKCDPDRLSYSGAWTAATLSLAQLAEHIGNGHPWMPAQLDAGQRRYQQYANHAGVLALDIDGGMTIAQASAHPVVAAHCGLGIESASSSPELNKYRLVFVLPRPVEGWKTIRICNRYLAHLVGTADPACKDASRYFFGAPGRVPFLLNESATLPSSFVEDAIAWHEAIEAQEQARAEQARRAWEDYKRQNPGQDTDALLLDALDDIPPDCDYNTWLAIGMAFAGMGDQWLSVWDSWSAGASSYKPGECDRKWKGFRGKRPAPEVIFGIAKKHGWRFPQRSAPDQTGDRPLRTTFRPAAPDAPGSGSADKHPLGNAFARKLEALLRHTPSLDRSVKPARAAALTAVDVASTVVYTPGCLPQYQPGGQKPAYTVEPDQMKEFIIEAVAKGWNVHDRRDTGVGKSHLFGMLDESDFARNEDDHVKLYYLDTNHRNPSTAPIEERFTDMPTRHNGLVVDENRHTALGKPFLRQPGAGDAVDRNTGNCIRTKEFAIARSKRLPWADSASKDNPLCRRCPFYGTCGQSEGIGKSGQGFRAMRREALQHSRLRMTPEQAPRPDKFPYNDVILGWEEAETLLVGESVHISANDINRQFSLIASRDPELSQKLSPVYLALSRLLNTKPGPHGLSPGRCMEILGPAPEWLDTSTIRQVLSSGGEDVNSLLGELDQGDTESLTQDIASLKSKINRREEWIADAGNRFRFSGNVGHQNDLFSQPTSEVQDQRELLTGVAAFEMRQQIADKTEEIAALQSELKDKLSLRESLRAANAYQRREDRREHVDRLLAAPVQGLTDVLKVWAGLTPGGSIRATYDGLVLYTPNEHAKAIARASRGNIFIDATADTAGLARAAGLPEDKVLMVVSETPAPNNIKRRQIPSYGRAAKGRAESTDELIQALVKAIAGDSSRAIIDWKDKASSHDGASVFLGHFSGGRGSNEAAGVEFLFMIGTPSPNVGAMEQQWLGLGGEDYCSFDSYYQSQVNAAILQEDGRSRAHRYPSQQFMHVYVTDAALPWPDVEVKQAHEVTVEAARQGDRTRIEVLRTMRQLKEQGKKVTQQAIAAAVGVTQGNVSHIFKAIGGWQTWKKIISASLESLYRDANNLLTALEGISDEVRLMAETLLPSVLEAFDGSPDSVVAVFQGIVDLAAMLAEPDFLTAVQLAPSKTRAAIVALGEFVMGQSPPFPPRFA